MFTLKPDFERTFERMEAFWAGDVLDRPVTQFVLPRLPAGWAPLPESRHASAAERWQDAAYQADLALAQVSNLEMVGDTLPVAWPNLGPDVFASFYGCPLHFGDYGTSWSEPILFDWAEADHLQFDWNHPYLRKLEEMTQALLEVGRGRFITGMSDWHPGGDCLAALRGPQNLAADLLEHPAEVKRLLGRIQADYFALYDHFYRMLTRAGQPISTWTPLVGAGKYYLPSNDFSIMVSPEMYAEFFLPGIIEECRFLDRSMYHLDGPGALRHLPALLEVKELNAVQFVPTEGQGQFSRWAGVYRRIQAAGKGAQVTCRFNELGEVMQALSPRGLYLVIEEAPGREEAENALRELVRWTRESTKREER